AAMAAITGEDFELTADTFTSAAAGAAQNQFDRGGNDGGDNGPGQDPEREPNQDPANNNDPARGENSNNPGRGENNQDTPDGGQNNDRGVNSNEPPASAQPSSGNNDNSPGDGTEPPARTQPSPSGDPNNTGGNNPSPSQQPTQTSPAGDDSSGNHPSQNDGNGNQPSSGQQPQPDAPTPGEGGSTTSSPGDETSGNGNNAPADEPPAHSVPTAQNDGAGDSGGSTGNGDSGGSGSTGNNDGGTSSPTDQPTHQPTGTDPSSLDLPAQDPSAPQPEQPSQGPDSLDLPTQENRTAQPGTTQPAEPTSSLDLPEQDSQAPSNLTTDPLDLPPHDTPSNSRPTPLDLPTQNTDDAPGDPQAQNAPSQDTSGQSGTGTPSSLGAPTSTGGPSSTTQHTPPPQSAAPTPDSSTGRNQTPPAQDEAATPPAGAPLTAAAAPANTTAAAATAPPLDTAAQPNSPTPANAATANSPNPASPTPSPTQTPTPTTPPSPTPPGDRATSGRPTPSRPNTNTNRATSADPNVGTGDATPPVPKTDPTHTTSPAPSPDANRATSSDPNPEASHPTSPSPDSDPTPDANDPNTTPDSPPPNRPGYNPDIHTYVAHFNDGRPIPRDPFYTGQYNPHTGRYQPTEAEYQAERAQLANTPARPQPGIPNRTSALDAQVKQSSQTPDSPYTKSSSSDYVPGHRPHSTNLPDARAPLSYSPSTNDRQDQQEFGDRDSQSPGRSNYFHNDPPGRSRSGKDFSSSGHPNFDGRTGYSESDQPHTSTPAGVGRAQTAGPPGSPVSTPRPVSGYKPVFDTPQRSPQEWLERLKGLGPALGSFGNEPPPHTDSRQSSLTDTNSETRDNPQRRGPHPSPAQGATAGSDVANPRTHPWVPPSEHPTVPIPVVTDSIADMPTIPLEQVEALSEELQDLYDTGLETPAGRAYYEPDDQDMRDSALALQAIPGFYTLDLHGSPEAAYIGDDELTAAELAELVRADPNWNGEPIRLFSCETGQGEDPFAQHLADELGVTVHAPTELAWGYADGTSIVSSAHCDSDTCTQPKWPPDGIWVRFHPTEN
ncbi:hypothetical protein ACFXNW_27065, partial [Nocardia sp. NPDC059180]